MTMRKAELGFRPDERVIAVREIPEPVTPDRVIVTMPTAEARRLLALLNKIGDAWYNGNPVVIRPRHRDDDLSMIKVVLDQVLS